METKRKPDLMQIIGITFIATSIALFDTSDWSWEANAKYFLGIAAGVFIIAFKIIIAKKRKP